MADLPSQGFAKYTLISDHKTLKNDSVSGKTSKRYVNGHLSKFNISFPPLTALEFSEIDGFLCDKSMFKSFEITLPDREPLGVATGTPLVNGALAKGISSIVTDGWTISQTGILKAGDILTFAGHTHVYTCTADTNSDGSGNATLTISPPLKQAIANNEAITVNSVKYTVRCTKPHKTRATPPVIYDFNFNVVEVT